MAVTHLGVAPTIQDIARAYGFKAEDVGPGEPGPVGTSDAPKTSLLLDDLPDEDPAIVFPQRLPLSRTYEIRGRKFSRLDLQEPSGVDYWRLGEPYTFTRVTAQLVVVDAIVRAYAAVCVKPVPSLSADEMVDALNFRDSRELRRAILDFFTSSEQPADTG